jgi:hypothetical protein
MQNKGAVRVESLGGLGNQLFVYFFGASVASNLECELEIDGRFIGLGSNSTRTNSLLEFKSTYENAKYISSRSSFITWISFKLRKIIDKYFGISNTFYENHVFDNGLIYKKGIRFNGYYQSWFYVDFFTREKLAYSLELKYSSNQFNKALTDLRLINPICVHLRVGDYLNFPEIYTVLPIEYFKKCIDLELEKQPNREVWFFIENSETIEHYGSSLTSIASRIIDRSSGMSDTESFQLMSMSSSLIAANSTYSLWAAWFVWKNGNTAYVPFQSFIAGVSNELMDERWNRYDFEKDVFYPGKFNQEKYDKMEREFLNKFA